MTHTLRNAPRFGDAQKGKKTKGDQEHQRWCSEVKRKTREMFTSFLSAESASGASSPGAEAGR